MAAVMYEGMVFLGEGDPTGRKPVAPAAVFASRVPEAVAAIPLVPRARRKQPKRIERRNGEIVMLRAQGCTLAAISRYTDLTRERVRQISRETAPSVALCLMALRDAMRRES